MTSRIDEEYRHFGATHACRYLEFDSTRWEYVACGPRAETVLLLPGALGSAETSFQYILALESSFRVISVGFPGNLMTVAALVEGVIGILDAERIDRVHLVAGSYGGLIAQSLVRRYPGRIDRLILCDVGAPRPDRAPRIKALLRIASLRPWSVVKALMRLYNRMSLPRDTGEQHFWRGYFDRVIDALTRQELIGRLSVALDFDEHYAFGDADVDRGDRILLVDAEDDHFFGAEERAAVRALYPGARLVTFRARGHSGTLDHAEDYIALYREFLNRTDELSNPG